MPAAREVGDEAGFDWSLGELSRERINNSPGPATSNAHCQVLSFLRIMPRDVRSSPESGHSSRLLLVVFFYSMEPPPSTRKQHHTAHDGSPCRSTSALLPQKLRGLTTN